MCDIRLKWPQKYWIFLESHDNDYINDFDLLPHQKMFVSTVSVVKFLRGAGYQGVREWLQMDIHVEQYAVLG